MFHLPGHFERQIEQSKARARPCATNHSRFRSAYTSSVAYHDAARNGGTAYLPIRCCARADTTGRQDVDVPGQSATSRMCTLVNRDRLTRFYSSMVVIYDRRLGQTPCSIPNAVKQLLERRRGERIRGQSCVCPTDRMLGLFFVMPNEMFSRRHDVPLRF